MFAQLVIDYRTWITAFGVVQIVLGSAVVILAFAGYARNRSRPMLSLGAGIASLTLLPVVSRYLLGPKLGIRTGTIVALSLETVGLVLVLYSILQARKA